jgi:hypothetical protein
MELSSFLQSVRGHDYDCFQPDWRIAFDELLLKYQTAQGHDKWVASLLLWDFLDLVAMSPLQRHQIETFGHFSITRMVEFTMDVRSLELRYLYSVV